MATKADDFKSARVGKTSNLTEEKVGLVPNQFIKYLGELSDNEIKEQTFKVEEELRLEFQKKSGSRNSGYICVLQRIVLEFMDKLYIYPLNSEFPERPGVYFIYYVGKTKLYEGSQVSTSNDNPVYVGQSKKSISQRLVDHCEKIKAAKNLNQADFVVRFMILDIHYVLTIEGMMIEHFQPVWPEQRDGKFLFN